MQEGEEGNVQTQPFHVVPARFTHGRVYQLHVYPRYPSSEFVMDDDKLPIGDISSGAIRKNTPYLEFKTNFDVKMTTSVEISGFEGITLESSTQTHTSRATQLCCVFITALSHGILVTSFAFFTFATVLEHLPPQDRYLEPVSNTLQRKVLKAGVKRAIPFSGGMRSSTVVWGIVSIQ